jgi:hypothetical protein
MFLIHSIDEGADVVKERQFFQALGHRGPIKSSEKGGDDEDFEQSMLNNNKLNIQKAIRKLYR